MSKQHSRGTLEHWCHQTTFRKISPTFVCATTHVLPSIRVEISLFHAISYKKKCVWFFGWNSTYILLTDLFHSFHKKTKSEKSGQKIKNDFRQVKTTAETHSLEYWHFFFIACKTKVRKNCTCTNCTKKNKLSLWFNSLT